MTREIDLSWAAGFIDGEGCVTLSRGKSKRDPSKWRPYLVLAVTQSYPEPLERLSKVAGHGNVQGPYSYSGGLSKKPIYRWQLSRKQAETFLRELEPYLCSEKKEKFKECLEWLTEFYRPDKVVIDD